MNVKFHQFVLYFIVSILLGLFPAFSAAQQRTYTPNEKARLEQAAKDHKTLVRFVKDRQFQQAIEIGKTVVNVRKELLGEHKDTALSLEWLGWTYEQKGDYSSALPLFLETKKIEEKVLGKEHPDYAMTLNNLAALYNSMGSYERAESLYLESKKIREKVLGKEHPDYAMTLNNLAALYNSMGSYERAESLYLESKKIREKVLGKEHPDYASSLNHLAALYNSMGSYERAEPLFLKSKKIREKVLGKEHPDYAMTLHSLAALYENMGSYERAEPLNQEAKKIWGKVLGKEHPLYATSLSNLAALYADMGSYERAEPLYLESKKIREKVLGKEHPSYATTLSNLAALYYHMGSYERAEPLFLESKKIREKVLGKEHPDYAMTLHNLAALYKSMGSYERAEPLYLETKKIQEKVLGKEHPSCATTLGNLAALYEDMGSYERAEPLYLESKKIREKVLGKEHPDYATTLHNLAALYADMGSYERAEPLYLETKKIEEKVLGKEHPSYATTLNSLADLYAKQEKYAKSTSLLDQARKTTASHITRVLPSLSADRRQDFLKNNFYGDLKKALSIAYASRTNSRSATLSAGWLLNSKAIVHQASAEAALLSTPQAVGQVQKLRNVRKQLAELAISTSGTASQEMRLKLVELENQEREINKELAAFRLIDTDTPWISLGQMRDNLPLASVMINFAKFTPIDIDKNKNLDPIYAAWIIPASGEGEVQLIPLGDAGKIESQVAAMRKQLNAAVAGKLSELGEGVLEKNFIEQAQKMSQLVFSPLEKHLTDIEEVLISPDGELWTIPWEALRTSDDKYLLEKYRMRYLTSGRELASNQRKGRYSGDPVIMADPDYDLSPVKIARVNQNNRQTLRSAAGATFTRLPSSQNEATAIKAPLEGYTRSTAKLLLGAEAQESAFKELHRPRSLVLSTHGYFDHHEVKDKSDIDVNPLLRCGLALAGANNRQQAMKDGKEDGILTGLEIVGTDLRGTELVVLSACETGLGDITSGEGVAGLRQAFQLAGAQSVVSSLWQVEDGETARLMKLFFQNLAEGKSKSEALRQAQLTRIKARRDRHGAAHPFFWAAFTLTGQD